MKKTVFILERKLNLKKRILSRLLSLGTNDKTKIKDLQLTINKLEKELSFLKTL